MTVRLKNQFLIGISASMRDLMISITSVPTLVHMTAPPSAWTYCNQLCKMKPCLIMNRWTSVTSHQTSWWQQVTQTFLILQMLQMQYSSHKQSHWLYLKVKKEIDCIFSTMHNIKQEHPLWYKSIVEWYSDGPITIQINTLISDNHFIANHIGYIIILHSNQIDSCMIIYDIMINYCLFNISSDLQ